MPAKKKTTIELPEIDENEQLVTVNPAETDNQLVYADAYTKFLKAAPDINQEAKTALLAIKNAKDEKQIKNARSLSKEAKSYKRTIEKARTFIKKQMDEQKEAVLAKFDDDLEKAGVNDLLDTLEEIGKCEKDFINQRKIKRWKELENVFKKTLPNYADLKDLKFSWFKDRHEKLVSGAVSRKVTDTDRSLVTNELYKLETNIQSVKQLEAQNLFDDKALTKLKQEITEKINGEDGGVSGFNAEIANAISDTNNRRNESMRAELTAQIANDQPAIDEQSINNEPTEKASIDETSLKTPVDETPSVENQTTDEIPLPNENDMPPVNNEVVPPEDEMAEIEAQNEAPMNDNVKQISSAIPQLILEANNMLYDGNLTSQDPQIKADTKMKFIQLIINAESDHYNNGDSNEAYVRQCLNTENSVETYHNVFDLIEEIAKL